MYLKYVSLQLMWYVGGDLEAKPPLKLYVGLTRSGIPTFFPAFYRRRIRERKNLVIRYCLSVCTLAKMIRVWPKGVKVKPTTIHIPKYRMGKQAYKICEELLTRSEQMLNAYTRGAFKRVPLRLGWNFKPIWSAGPNCHYSPELEGNKNSLQSLKNPKKDRFTIWHTLPIDAGALITLWKPEQLKAVSGLRPGIT